MSIDALMMIVTQYKEGTSVSLASGLDIWLVLSIQVIIRSHAFARIVEFLSTNLEAPLSNRNETSNIEG